jgi:acyl carrier protein
MISENTFELIRETLIDVLDLDDDVEITTATTAEDIEEWDSLSHVRLIVAVERKFGIRFQNSEIGSLMNVGDLVRLIEARRALA